MPAVALYRRYFARFVQVMRAALDRDDVEVRGAQHVGCVLMMLTPDLSRRGPCQQWPLRPAQPLPISWLGKRVPWL
jgi:hypothetical protein